jgi:excisionase family DNA binding protein
MRAPASNKPKLLRIREAAAHLGVSEATVYRLMRTGELPVIEISSKRTAIDPRDLEAFIRRRKRIRNARATVGSP